MSEFRDQFLDMLYHADETMQEPTAWEVGQSAEVGIIKDAEFRGYQLDISGKIPLKYFGIDVITDASLPEDKVVLKCGENTAGAFHISQPDTQRG
jgi:hypothetical protein